MGADHAGGSGPADASAADTRFAGPEAAARVAVIVVTHNSADHLDRLLTSLRHEAIDVALRVIVADNESTDDTIERLGRWPDVQVLRSANRGYAAGINAAARLAGDVEALLVLNPDLAVRRGAVAVMLRRLDEPGVGVVVPRILDPDGSLSWSLRREPTVLGTLGDALLGSRLVSRPSWASETVWTPSAYRVAHRIDWATGAALMVRADVAARVGPWDEQFFMYSEETDYCRRVRAAGHEVWFEPAGEVVHARGGSGSSPQLTAMMEVNRVRYARTHGGRVRAGATRAVVLLGSLLRSAAPGHRLTVRRLLAPYRWQVAEPPPSSSSRRGAAPAPDVPIPGSVVIPAHDEERSIARTLAPLADDVARGLLEVVVVCNGCTDRTADVARGVPGIRVLELPEPSKTAALRSGDQAVSRFPRAYLDADVAPAPGAISALFGALADHDALAARPRTVDDLDGAGWAVRAFYRVRHRIPGLHTRLWGAGCFAVSEAGHARVATFPDVTADDLWVDEQFAAHETVVATAAEVTVRRPRTVRALLAVLRRTRSGNRRMRATGTPSGRTLSPVDLLRTVRGPVSLAEAITYVVLVVTARVQSRTTRRASGWERDETSRS